VAASAPLLWVHAGLLVAALLLAAVAVLMPSSLGGTAFVDWRLPIMALLAAAAGSRPEFRTGRAASVAACSLLLLSLVRTGWIAGIWHERQSDIRAVERALAPVPAGAAVLPAQHMPAPSRTPAPRGRYSALGPPSHWHHPALAVPRRAAFVPTLFTAPGKQPLRVVPPWDAISVLEGVPAPVHLLRSFVRSPDVLYAAGYAENWRTRFDYVLLVNADLPDADGELPPQPELELLADEGFARLYRIRRGAPAGLDGCGAETEPAAGGDAPRPGGPDRVGEYDDR